MTALVETVAGLRLLCDDARTRGLRVGLVPTMGYLHDGHRSLMRAARGSCDFVVVTIFVNPLQFGPQEDLDQYPRDLDGDIAACAAEGVDVVFHPPVGEMYPAGAPATTVHVAGLTEGMCGATRPTHFDGVATVVAKLFSIAGRCTAFFGEKDYQQLAVVRRMALDLDLPVEVVGCPLVREPDGVAMSSRNAYLTTEQRVAARALRRALEAATEIASAGERDPAVVARAAHAVLEAEDLVEPEYVVVRDADDLSEVDRLDGRVVVAIAARVGATRLIDNVRLTTAGARVEAEFGTGTSISSGRE